MGENLLFFKPTASTCSLRSFTSVNLRAIVLAFAFIFWGAGSAFSQTEFPCEISIDCPTDVTLECGDDINDHDLTGYPVVNESNCFGEIVVTSSDAVVFQDGTCFAVIVRTWTASVIGGPSAMCEQTINVIDSEGPVFVNPPADASYQCIGEVPQAEELETTDCGDLTEIVIFEPTDVDSLECTLTTPVGPGPDWAVWLNGLAGLGLAAGDYYTWVPGTANMYYGIDGTALITGDIVNMNNASQTWTVTFWMENGQNWTDWSAQGRSYKDDLGFGAAHYEDWTYYELVPVFSHLVGTGANAGSNLYMSHQPANYYFGFQFGVGANNRNGNDGGSGWFYYWGYVNGEYVNNHGDLTTDKQCVPIEIPNLVCESSLTRLWSAVDECGNVSFHEQNITIFDSTAPVFTYCPDDDTVECSEEIPAAISVDMLSATDNCNGPVDINYLGQEMADVNNCDYDITHLYEAVDTCGNRSFCSYVIHVVDNTAPELMIPADATIECDQDVVWADASAIDACHNETVTISYGEPVFNEDACYGYWTRVVSANDGCDNIATGTQTINIVDTTLPTFDAYEAEVFVECTEVDQVAILTADDNCDEQVEVTYTEILNSGGCLGVLMRTYTATDNCGNSATAVQYIHILDTTPAYIDEPVDQTVECSLVPEAPGAEGAEIWDNCGYDVTVEFHTEMQEGECEDSYTILWIWEAWDYCENYSTDTTVITVVDTTDPELSVPQGGTFSCDEEIVYGSASATDNCDELVEITYSDVETPGECPQEYSVVRTWIATDNCGNSSTGSATYYVVDNDAPVFTSVPQNITIECGDDVPVTSAEAEDNCGEVTISSNDVYEIQTTCLTVIVRTFTATDECGNWETASHTITIEDNLPPVITYENEISRPCDDYMGIYATALDICSGEAEVFIVVDELVSGSCAGRIIRTYGSYDDCDNYASVQQIINLTDIVPPVIQNDPLDMTIECGLEIPVYVPEWYDNCDMELDLSAASSIAMDGCLQIITQTYTAVDHCGNSTTVDRVITVEDTTNPYFEEIPANTTINCYDEVPAIVVPMAYDICDEQVDVEVTVDTIDGECPQEYTIVRTFRAYDDCGNDAVESQLISVVDNDAPVFGEQAYLFSYECDEVIPVVEPSVSDLCGEVTLTSYDFWFEQSDCAGYMSRIWTATDECGNSSEFAQFINIYDETAPVITGEIEISLPCDDYMGIYASATDNCTEEVEVFWVGDQEVSGACAGRLIRIYGAYDDCDNYTEFEQTITLIDTTAPVASSNPDDATYECDEEWSPATVTFEDNCDDDLVLTANVTSETDGCTTVYHYIWTAVDHCQNTTSVDQYITVTDYTAPTASFDPQDLTVECGQFWDVVVPTFNDNCDEELTLDSDYSEEVVDCNTIITYWWSATDDCGNSTTVGNTVTIEDTTPPVLVTPQGGSYSCDEEWAFGETFAYDICDEVVDVVCEEVVVPGDCPQSYSIVRTCIATDDCGNSTTGSTTVFIYDDEAPVFTSVPADQTIECNTDVPASQATAEDNCDLEVTITQSDEIVWSTDCYTEIERTFVATDDCGNMEYATQHFYIVDTTDPIIAGDIEITMPCDNISNEILVTATDNCDDEVYIEILSDIYNSGSCAGVIERTYIAWDNCENSSTFVQFIVLTDTTAPVASVDPQDLTVECGNEWAPANVTFEDNCDDELTLIPDMIVTEEGCNTIYHYIWTAIDHCDNTTTVDQYITIVDTIAPVIDDQNSEITVDCNVMVDYALPTAEDVCDGEVEVVPGYSSVDGECPGYYTEYITFTATDDCGNSSVVTHIVHHVDEDAPMLTNIPDGGEYECDEDLPMEEPTAFDYCSEATVYSDEEIFPGDCPNSYEVVRYFWAIDECGNQSETIEVSYWVYDDTNPTFDNEVSDESYQCIDWETYEVQNVTASDNCGTAAVTHDIVADDVDECGNGSWTVYYTATDLCGNMSYQQYSITIEDTIAPELSDMPADLMLDCGDELPAEPVITATDNCDLVTVSYNEECMGDCPVEGETNCDLITPVRPANNPCNYPVDWAMALFGMPSSHKWYQLVPNTGSLTDNGDGSITVSGSLVNAYDNACGFNFNVTFANGLDWSAWSSQAFPTGFKADCGAEAANHEEWMYYILQASQGAELIGWGTYAGSMINLVHAPANQYFGFQYGDGANNYNGANGFGGWFSYNGVFLVDGEPIMSGNVGGAGDFAFEVDCCPDYQIVRCWTAEDCSGNEVMWCQTITFGDLDSDFTPASAEIDAPEVEKGDIAIVSVQPNPANNKAQISFISNDGGKLSLQVLDMTGRVVADLYNGVVEAGIVYKADLDADRMPAGIYMVRLNSDTESDIDRIQITK